MERYIEESFELESIGETIALPRHMKLSSNEVLHVLQDSCDFYEDKIDNIATRIYAEKLSLFAFWEIIHSKENIVGYVAYYLNNENHYIYIPLICIYPQYQRRHLAQLLIKIISQYEKSGFKSIRLEVAKTNNKAVAFYLNNSFEIMEDRGRKFLLEKHLL